MRRAVVVVLDGLRRDLIGEETTPALCALRLAGAELCRAPLDVSLRHARRLGLVRDRLPSRAPRAAGQHAGAHGGRSPRLSRRRPSRVSAAQAPRHRPLAGGADAGRAAGAARRHDPVLQRVAGRRLRPRPRRPCPCLPPRRLVRAGPPPARGCAGARHRPGRRRRAGHDRALHRRGPDRAQTAAGDPLDGRAGCDPACQAAGLAGAPRRPAPGRCQRGPRHRGPGPPARCGRRGVADRLLRPRASDGVAHRRRGGGAGGGGPQGLGASPTMS